MTAATLNLQAGEVVFREGDAPGAAYLIESGKIEVSVTQNHQRLVLSYLSTGDLLGEMAAIDDAPRSAEARAVEASVLTIIERDQIHERLNEADPIVRALMGSLLHRYRSGLRAARGSAGTQSSATGPKAALGQVKLEGQAANKFRLEKQLMGAIENDELSVVFQPLYEFASKRVVGFEALTRWAHPERGNISPAEFIALAEETSLILPVGQYALRKSCEALKRLDNDYPDCFIAVNISARQSAVPDFAELIEQQARMTGIDPKRLELEITESLTLDYDLVRTLIERCHSLGIRISLDDFGTGLSNLGHLHELEFDTVKLDQAFTRQMMTNERCFELVRGIVNMIHAIGAKVIAEGVETREQAEKLRGLGVEYLQGWYIGRPAPPEEMHAFLARIGMP